MDHGERRDKFMGCEKGFIGRCTLSSEHNPGFQFQQKPKGQKLKKLATTHPIFLAHILDFELPN